MSDVRELASRGSTLFAQTVGNRWNAIEPTWKGERKRSFEAMHVRAARFGSERFATQVEAFASAVEAAVRDLE